MPIFLDVDGVLIPFRARDLSSGDDTGNPLLNRLDPADGPRLLALGRPLVWATTWMDDANDVISPRLGLPRLPVVDWPDNDCTISTDPATARPGDPTYPATPQTSDPTVSTAPATTRPMPGLHWKTVVLSRWAAGHPFVWLDDEITDADQRWVAAHHPAPALLHRVDPRVGLANADLLTVRQWLDAV